MHVGVWCVIVWCFLVVFIVVKLKYTSWRIVCLTVYFVAAKVGKGKVDVW